MTTMRVDVHCHFGQRSRPCPPDDRFSFEPAGPDRRDAYFSDCLYQGPGMHLAWWFFGVPRNLTPAEADRHIEQRLLEHVLGATRIDRVVALAFDEHHSFDGQASGPRARRRETGTDLYVSNTYARGLSQRYPHRILFGASIHPYRRVATRSAIDMLEEVAGAGAVLVKWLPLTQNIDARDERTVTFLRHAAHVRVPLLIHYGGEAALGNFRPDFEDPGPLLETLEHLRRHGDMPTVIVAHAATPMGWPVATRSYFRPFCRALTNEFADAPLYADISALALFSRARWLKRLARMPGLHHKLVYGSDFPVPATPLAFRRRLGSRYREVLQMPSWIDRDVVIKEAMGFPEHVFTRGAELLEHRIRAADRLVRAD